MKETSSYARSKNANGKRQEIKDHLLYVSELAAAYAGKIGLEDAGRLAGLLHDLGKYSQAFQTYLLKAEKNYGAVKRGSVDHSTAGAKYSYQKIQSLEYPKKTIKDLSAQLTALTVLSHHSGLIDMIDRSGANVFYDRLEKDEKNSHFEEVLSAADDEILNNIKSLFQSGDILEQIDKSVLNIVKFARGNLIIFHFHIGLLCRFMFSCLVDADFSNSADFESGKDDSAYRLKNKYTGWDIISGRLEKYLSGFKADSEVNIIRNDISRMCFNAGQTYEKGCYRLAVPTGGGKTLASFRFAVEHAKKHKMDRIVYCMPFTTIIDQNADIIRKIAEVSDSEKDSIVLEHHSNLSPEKNTYKNKILSENWDIPIIFTTNVQLLDTLFASGASSARKMHRLVNSVIIFDEIQTLPVKCAHMFNNAINFLTNSCGSTVVLCTATQPLLDQVDPEKGCTKLSEKPDIVNNVKELFDKLKRVEIIDKSSKKQSAQEVSEFALSLLESNNSCLIVCNTTKTAKQMFESLSKKTLGTDITIYHLSAKMYPKHRKDILAKIKDEILKEKKIIVVSTQLIEAGVDIDFNCGIRAVAGLDSVAQAAGRVNRNGLRGKSYLYIVDFDNENLDCLIDIKKGKEQTQRVIREVNGDLLFPESMVKYYQYYFYDRKDEMSYTAAGLNATLLDMLSINGSAANPKRQKESFLRQSFEKAAKAFNVIDTNTKSVIVCVDECIDIIDNLAKEYNPEIRAALLKRAQQYSVNIYEKEFNELLALKALSVISEELDIYYLHAQYYDKKFGISREAEFESATI